MTEKTLNEVLKTFVQDQINIPYVHSCKVIGNYPSDPTKVDVTTNAGELKNIPCLFNNEIGQKGIIIYLNNDENQPIALIENRELWTMKTNAVINYTATTQKNIVLINQMDNA